MHIKLNRIIIKSSQREILKYSITFFAQYYGKELNDQYNGNTPYVRERLCA